KESFNNGLFNFKLVEIIANENKDLMISNKDAGEHEYNTAITIYRALCASVNRLNVIRADVMEAEQTAKAAGPGSLVEAEAQFVGAKIDAIRNAIENVRHSAEDKLLPVYVRKKTAW